MPLAEAVILSDGTRLPADAKTTNGRIGCMTLPVFGAGALAGRPVVDMQGLGISAGSKSSAAGFKVAMGRQCRSAGGGRPQTPGVSESFKTGALRGASMAAMSHATTSPLSVESARTPPGPPDRWWGLPQPRPAWPNLERWYAGWLAQPCSRGVLDLPLA